MNRLQRKEIVVQIAKRLIEVPIDEIISLRDINDAIGQDLTECRWPIYAALRVVNSEFGVVFATVRGEGYRRLAHGTGALFAGGRGLYRIRRASRAALKTAANAARFANDMSADERRRHHQQMASLGLVSHLTMMRSVESMPDVAPAERPDPLAGLRAALGL